MRWEENWASPKLDSVCRVERDKTKSLEHRWGICPAWPQGVVSSLPLEEGKQRLIIDRVIENQVFHQTTGLHQQFPHFLFPRAPFIIFPFGLHVLKDFVKQTNCTYWVITNTFPHFFLIKRVCMCVRERSATGHLHFGTMTTMILIC